MSSAATRTTTTPANATPTTAETARTADRDTTAKPDSKAPADGAEAKPVEKSEKEIDEALDSTFPASDPVSAHSEVEAPENPGMNEPAKPTLTKVPQPPCCAEPHPRNSDSPAKSP